MDDVKEIAQLRRIALEAIEMLEDVKHKFGLFENQRLGKIKGRLSDYNRLDKPLASSLSKIETSDD